MRVLFIPCARGVLSHLIPLMALRARLDTEHHRAAFLLPARYHQPLRSRGWEVIDVDYRRDGAFRAEMSAFGRFRPDVVVDDLSETVLLSTAAARIPRVTVRRTGTFPGALPRNANHRHSILLPDSEADSFAQFYRNSEIVCGVRAPGNVVEMCAADMNVVPGIGAIELLPTELAGDPSYAFAGALVVSDAESAAANGCSPDAGPLLEFFERNRQRQLVYVTLGNILTAHESIREVIRHLLATDRAVVSSVALDDLREDHAAAFHYAPYLPMHTVCANVQLMIHHCGSGTYQYQIIHTLPAICIGSQCYDRDDVAMRLEELGVARYLPSPDEKADFVSRFRQLLRECSDPAGDWYRSAKENLRALKAQTERAMADFDFETVLEGAIS